MNLVSLDLHLFLFTVDAILRKKSLSSEHLSKKCDDSLFLRLSTQITQSIDILAISLNLTRADAEQIRRDKDDERSRIVETLFKWREKNGSDATYLALVKVFIQDEKRELAEFVMDYFISQIQGNQKIIEDTSSRLITVIINMLL